MSEHNTWTDWRGNDYTVGDVILYARMSGRSCEMAEGVVTDLYEVYYGEDYRWHKLEPGEPVPEHTTWGWRNTETGEVSTCNMRWKAEEGEPWEREQVTVPRDHERRAKIMPTNRTSRFGGYRTRKFTWDAKTGTGEMQAVEPKPVTLKVTESITVPKP